MGLIVFGIDEAGYGPLLGPLCVAAAGFRISGWAIGDAAPDLWLQLSGAVCRDLQGARRGLLPIADSKRLKLPNQVSGSAPRRSPTMHLERGVLAFRRAMGVSDASDAELLEGLGCVLPRHSCYGGEPIELPLAWTGEQIAIAGSVLAGAMSRAGVEPLGLSCIAVGETEFNALVRSEQSKAATTIGAIGAHLRGIWAEHAAGESTVWVVCDRLGGRARYGSMLAHQLKLGAGGEVTEVEESERRSRYFVREAGPEGERRLHVTFVTEGETAQLPVALASMTAKLVRELAMMRFNRSWCARMAAVGQPELKPTAGYREDGARWLRDAAPVLTEADRRALVRIA